MLVVVVSADCPEHAAASKASAQARASSRLVSDCVPNERCLPTRNRIWASIDTVLTSLKVSLGKT